MTFQDAGKTLIFDLCCVVSSQEIYEFGSQLAIFFWEFENENSAYEKLDSAKISILRDIFA